MLFGGERDPALPGAAPAPSPGVASVGSAAASPLESITTAASCQIARLSMAERISSEFRPHRKPAAAVRAAMAVAAVPCYEPIVQRHGPTPLEIPALCRRAGAALGGDHARRRRRALRQDFPPAGAR